MTERIEPCWRHGTDPEGNPWCRLPRDHDGDCGWCPLCYDPDGAFLIGAEHEHTYGPGCAGHVMIAELAAAWHAGWVAGCNDQQYGDESAHPWTPNPYNPNDLERP